MATDPVRRRKFPEGWLTCRQRVTCAILVILQIALLAGFARVAQKKAVVRAERRARIGAPFTPPAVTPLSELTLEAFTQTFQHGALVKFHSLGCSHCAALEPEFEDAAKMILSANGPPFASVDADLAPRLTEKLGVHSYPTILWFRRGVKVLEVPHSVRTAALLLEWVDFNMQPSVVELDSLEDLDDAMDQVRKTLRPQAAPVVVAIEASHREPSFLIEFEKVSEQNRGTTVFIYIKSDFSQSIVRTIYDNAERDEEVVGPFVDGAVAHWISERLRKT